MSRRACSCGRRGGALACALGLLLALGAAECRRAEEPGEGILWRMAAPPESVGVGDALQLVIEAAWPDSLGRLALAWRAPGDTLLEIGRDSVELAAAPGQTHRRYTLAVLAPRAGSLRVAAPALVSAARETLALGRPLSLRVGAQRAAGDEDLRPIAPLLSLGGFPAWAVALGLALLTAFAVWFWVRRRGQRRRPAPRMPPVPAAAEFGEALAALRARRLAEQGAVRAHVQELSWIFRRYLGRRWEQPALEATRPEIVRWLPVTRLCMRDQGEVASWLAETDQIKFAGVRPLLAEVEQLAARAGSLVERSERAAAPRGAETKAQGGEDDLRGAGAASEGGEASAARAGGEGS